jgi:hypothetical protein
MLPRKPRKLRPFCHVSSSPSAGPQQDPTYQLRILRGLIRGPASSRMPSMILLVPASVCLHPSFVFMSLLSISVPSTCMCVPQDLKELAFSLCLAPLGTHRPSDRLHSSASTRQVLSPPPPHHAPGITAACLNRSCTTRSWRSTTVSRLRASGTCTESQAAYPFDPYDMILSPVTSHPSGAARSMMATLELDLF